MGDQEAARLPDTREAWNRYGLEQIWLMVRDEDGNDSYAQVAAWYRMGRLCTDQADQLQKALDQLMIKWPPNPGSAAHSFKLMVDEFILSMRDSAAAAQANEAPLIAITSLLSDAKDAIGQLRQKQIANEKVEREWSLQATNLLAPVSPPRIDPRWREDLDRQARDIMHATDVAIGKAASQFQSPVRFGGPAWIDSHVPVDPNDHHQDARPAVRVPEFDPPEPSSIATVSEPSFFDDVADSAHPTLDGGSLPPSDQLRSGGGSDSLGTFVDTPAGRVLAPGGVIGAIGTAAGAAARAYGATSTGGNRGTNGAPGMVAPPIGRGVTAQPGRGGAKSAGRRRRRTDPDDPWVPPAGGPSILEPAPEPDYFDPGPNVIGIDR